MEGIVSHRNNLIAADGKRFGQTLKDGLGAKPDLSAVSKGGGKTALDGSSLQNVILVGDIFDVDQGLELSYGGNVLRGLRSQGELPATFSKPFAGDKPHLRVDVVLDGKVACL